MRHPTNPRPRYPRIKEKQRIQRTLHVNKSRIQDSISNRNSLASTLNVPYQSRPKHNRATHVSTLQPTTAKKRMTLSGSMYFTRNALFSNCPAVIHIKLFLRIRNIAPRKHSPSLRLKHVNSTPKRNRRQILKDQNPS